MLPLHTELPDKYTSATQHDFSGLAAYCFELRAVKAKKWHNLTTDKCDEYCSIQKHCTAYGTGTTTAPTETFALILSFHLRLVCSLQVYRLNSAL